MITTIQEGDILTIELIHARNEAPDYISDAIVKRVDMVGLIVSVQVYFGYNKETKTARYNANDVFIPWSNIMAAHVYREQGDGCDEFETFEQVLGHQETDDDGNVITIQERRHRQLLEAQSNVTYYNGDM